MARLPADVSADGASAALLTADERQRLLRQARAALTAHVGGRPPPALAVTGGLACVCGAFVTLHLDGRLRGCMGRTDPDRPLAVLVTQLAAVVADSDPRFPPVTAAELAGITIEISVLTTPTAVATPAAVDAGRHGLIVERGAQRGLLLPQVARERGWTRETLLEHTCLKAGLPRDAWTGDARLYVFEADVFGEGRPPG